MALHVEHGKLVRTGPTEVSVADLSAIKTIYASWVPTFAMVLNLELTYCQGLAPDLERASGTASSKVTASLMFSAPEMRRYMPRNVDSSPEHMPCRR